MISRKSIANDRTSHDSASVPAPVGWILMIHTLFASYRGDDPRDSHQGTSNLNMPSSDAGQCLWFIA
ncbi:MAG: hypothetical protein KatS3mg111_4294 [Pirellulaceae bacterium]|nr:MAG: hypothetical protein KatS3mg111_4294 [Pirellulaceae bacterium]